MYQCAFFIRISCGTILCSRSGLWRLFLQLIQTCFLCFLSIFPLSAPLTSVKAFFKSIFLRSVWQLNSSATTSSKVNKVKKKKKIYNPSKKTRHPLHPLDLTKILAIEYIQMFIMQTFKTVHIQKQVCDLLLAWCLGNWKYVVF